MKQLPVMRLAASTLTIAIHQSGVMAMWASLASRRWVGCSSVGRVGCEAGAQGWRYRTRRYVPWSSRSSRAHEGGGRSRLAASILTIAIHQSGVMGMWASLASRRWVGCSSVGRVGCEAGAQGWRYRTRRYVPWSSRSSRAHEGGGRSCGVGRVRV